jgi:hypothetical protein
MQQAMPYLVRSAFAKLPFSEYQHWRVKLQPASVRGNAPQFISVQPVRQ